MSVARDRFTFFAVMLAVGVAVVGYLQIGERYPAAGRDNAAVGGEEGPGEQGPVEEAGHSDEPVGHDPARPTPDE